MEWRKLHPDTIYVVGSQLSDYPDGHWLEYLKDYWREAGLSCGVCDGCNSKRNECEKAFVHRFRHTYAHRCLDKRMDLHTLSRNMGHHDISVTTIYLKGRKADMTDDPFAEAA